MAKVVSIFGGSRRSHPTPEITNDDKAESHVEIEKEISSPEPETKSPGAQVVDDIFARLRASSPAEVAKNITKEAKDTKDAKESKIQLVKSPPKKPIAITPILDAQKFSDRDASIAPLIVNMSKKLKRVGADELNAVLEHLNVKKSSLEIAAIVGTTSAHTKHHALAINDDIMAAATEGAKSMKSAGGSTKRITKKAVGDAVNAMLLETIVQPLRDRLAKIVVDSNGNREDIAKAVRSMYRDWKLTHIDAHTEDLACVAYSMGSHLSLEVGTPVCWMVDPNGPECADAEDNALSGVTPCGEKFPTGHEHPLAHMGCRCLVAPPTH